jgi:homoserine/homoserine lactone efflux protein
MARGPNCEELTRGWASGTIRQLANPKALVFFAAIVPPFIDPHANVALQIGILSIAGLLVSSLFSQSI